MKRKLPTTFGSGSLKLARPLPQELNIPSFNVLPTGRSDNDGRQCNSHDQSTKHFSYLPVELLENIADNLNLSEICNLRLLCKDLSAMLFSAFARAFFTDHVFLISDRISIQTLRVLSADPGFNRHIRHLRFTTDVLMEYDANYWSRERRTNRANQISNLSIARVYNGLREDERLFLRKDKRQFPRRDERQFRKQDLEYEMETIFRNLAQANIFIDISFAASCPLAHHASKCDNNVWGRRRLTKLLQCKAGISVTRRSDDACSYKCDVLNALTVTQYRPRGLHMSDSGVCIHRFDEQIPLSWFLTSAGTRMELSNLVSLKLGIDADRRGLLGSLHSPQRQRNIEGVVSFVARAPNVQDFALSLLHRNGVRIYSLPDESAQYLRDIFHALATKRHLSGSPLQLTHQGKVLSKVKTLELGWHLIPVQLLLDFLSERTETLKKVFLMCVAHGYEEWPFDDDKVQKAIDADRNIHFGFEFRRFWFDPDLDLLRVSDPAEPRLT